MVGGVRDVAQGPLPGEYRKAMHRGPDRVLDAVAPPPREHPGVHQLVQRGAQMPQGRAVLPGPAIRGAVGMLLRQGERGCEQPRLLAGEPQVCHADRAQPAAGRGGVAVLAVHAGDTGRAQRSPRIFDATILQSRLYSRGYHPSPAELAELRSAITRRDGAAFLHRAAGFTAEHRRHARRWDLAAIAHDLRGTAALYIGGSDEDPYEHRQIQATRERVPQAGILTFPGGHLTTTEQPGLLAAAIRDVAERHGVGTPAAASR